MRYVLIMAGGSGKRLWPVAARHAQATVASARWQKPAADRIRRLDGIVPPEQVLVCTGADYADIVAAELLSSSPRTC
jgi:mannose-1-phosphate guanylyltransferase